MKATNDDKVAYEAIVKKIKEKKSARNRGTILIFLVCFVIGTQSLDYYEILPINVPILIIGIMTLLTLFIFCPLGRLSPDEIQEKIVKRIGVIVSEEMEILSLLEKYKNEADLKNDHWSEHLQEKRNFYQIIKEDMQEELSSLDKEKKELESALRWMRAQ